MYGYHGSDYYDVQFTTRQLVLLFGLLIVIVVGVFVGGIVIGRGMAPGTADALIARRTNPAPLPAPAKASSGTVGKAPAEDALRLPIRSEPQPAARTADRAPARSAPAVATPSRAAATPSGAAATPSRTAATPSRTAATPSGAAATPSGAAAPAPQPVARTASSTGPEQLSNRTLASRPARAAAAAPAASTSAAASAASTPAASASPRTADRPRRAGAGQFTIQVAAFRERASAERVLQQLAARGLEGYLEGTSAGIFRVRVGQFESREAARPLVARLESEKFATLVTSR